MWFHYSYIFMLCMSVVYITHSFPDWTYWKTKPETNQIIKGLFRNIIFTCPYMRGESKKPLQQVNWIVARTHFIAIKIYTQYMIPYVSQINWKIGNLTYVGSIHGFQHISFNIVGIFLYSFQAQSEQRFDWKCDTSANFSDDIQFNLKHYQIHLFHSNAGNLFG